MRDAMNPCRLAAGLAAILFGAAGLSPGRLSAEEPPPAGGAAAPEAPEPWALSLVAYTYVVNDDGEEDAYVQPTVTLDRGALHLEARYNYEARNTASVWAGWNFGGGEELEWEITPMLGGVFGHDRGIAPGYRGALRWRWLEFYSEGEYVYDTRDATDSYFYNWSELTATVVEWLRFGLVTQHTRVYDNDREIQRGFLVGVDLKKANMTLHVFNPDDEHPTYVVSLGVDF